VLSFLTHRRWKAEIKGLEAFPRDQWPQNIPLLYYCYHIMVGLGTIFIAVTGLAALLLWHGSLFERRGMLWVLMIAMPFPYIANEAGWVVAEVGRQPWTVYGLQRVADANSLNVTTGMTYFTLLGFMGLYLVLGILYLLLFARIVNQGPQSAATASERVHA
jgi:cytochrome d ubiquinol oxidase subunit I